MPFSFSPFFCMVHFLSSYPLFSSHRITSLYHHSQTGLRVDSRWLIIARTLSFYALSFFMLLFSVSSGPGLVGHFLHSSLLSTQLVEYRPPLSQFSFALALIYAPHISHSRLPIASAFVVQYNVFTLIVFVSYHALKSTFATMQYMYHAISICVSVNDRQPNFLKWCARHARGRS